MTLRSSSPSNKTSDLHAIEYNPKHGPVTPTPAVSCHRKTMNSSIQRNLFRGLTECLVHVRGIGLLNFGGIRPGKDIKVGGGSEKRREIQLSRGNLEVQKQV